MDVYALSFFIYDEDDDETRPTLTLGYNTNERWKAAAATYSDPVEAKWNYAFWIQNELVVLGAENTESAEIRDTFIKSLLSYYDKTQYFVDSCVMVARRLHGNAVVARKFGGPIPILIHELEYYPIIAYQTSAANPNGLAEEFVKWVLGD